MYNTFFYFHVRKLLVKQYHACEILFYGQGTAAPMCVSTPKVLAGVGDVIPELRSLILEYFGFAVAVTMASEGF